MNCYIVCFSLSSSFTMSPIHGVLDLATNYFRPKHTLYAINYITCRFQNCTGRHWSSSTAVGINWQTAEDILDVIHYTVCKVYAYTTCAVDRTSGRPSVCPPGSVAPAHLPNPGNRQIPPSRREVTSHSVRGHCYTHARHSVEYSHPWVRLSAALGKPIVHLWVLAFSHSFCVHHWTAGLQSHRLPPAGANQRLRFLTHHHAHGARFICGTLFSAGYSRPFRVILCVSRSPCLLSQACRICL